MRHHWEHKQGANITSIMLTCAVHLVGVGACDTDRVEQVFQAMWHRP